MSQSFHNPESNNSNWQNPNNPGLNRGLEQLVRAALRDAWVEMGVEDSRKLISVDEARELHDSARAYMANNDWSDPEKQEEIGDSYGRKVGEKIQLTLALTDRSPESVIAEMGTNIDKEFVLLKNSIEHDDVPFEALAKGGAESDEAMEQIRRKAYLDHFYFYAEGEQHTLVAQLLPIVTLLTALGAADLRDELHAAEDIHRKNIEFRRTIFECTVASAMQDPQIRAKVLSGLSTVETKEMFDRSTRKVIPTFEEYMAMSRFASDSQLSMANKIADILQSQPLLSEILGNALESMINQPAMTELREKEEAQDLVDAKRIYAK